jgi:hypothetical protein
VVVVGLVREGGGAGEEEAPSPEPSPMWSFLKKFFMVVARAARSESKVAVAAVYWWWWWWWVGGSDMATDAGSGGRGNFVYAPIDSPASGPDHVTLLKLSRCLSPVPTD